MNRLGRGLVLALAACSFFPARAANDKPAQKIEGWGEVVDPDGDCKVSEDKGRISITVPGAYHDLWAGQGKVNAPLVLQEVEGDFVVQVKIIGSVLPEPGNLIPDIASKVPFRSGTLVIWQDNKNFVRLDRAGMVRQGQTYSFCYLEAFEDGQRAVDTDSKKVINGGSSPFADQDTYLRLDRREGKIHAAYSQDGGKHWTDLPLSPAAVDLPLKVKVGVAALNSTTKPFTVGFEELKITTEGKPK